MTYLIAEGDAKVTTCADTAAACCSAVSPSTVFVVYVRIILHLKPRACSMSCRHHAHTSRSCPLQERDDSGMSIGPSQVHEDKSSVNVTKEGTQAPSFEMQMLQDRRSTCRLKSRTFVQRGLSACSIIQARQGHFLGERGNSISQTGKNAFD